MSVQRGYPNAGHFYSNIWKPIKIDLNFIVDSANGNGLGIRSLKSNGYVENVFMHTSSTPGSNNGHLNPNPAAGIIMIQFKNNYNKYLGGFSGCASPVTGGSLTSTTNHVAYIITSLGTATLAQWQAAGLLPGITPAVGVPFIAIATGTIGGSAAVHAVGVSAVSHFEVIGDSSLTINSSITANSGQLLIVQALAPTISTGAYIAPFIPTAPADGTVIGMSAFFDGSSVNVDGL